MYLRLLPVAVAALIISGCAGAPKGPFDQSDFAANKKSYTESYTDVSNGDILTESKKVIIPNFKVYFQTEAKGASESGNFLTSNNARVSGKLRLAVDPKVLQELTDEMYNQLVADLKAQGYTVIDPTAFAEMYPDFKKYAEADYMKPTPQDIDGQYLAYSPTGWKMELPGFELGKNATGQLASAFRQNLMKIMAKATDELEAISIEPVMIIGFGAIEGSRSHTTASIEAKQNISVMAQSKYGLRESWDMGHILLEKNFESGVDYGRIVRADTAGDTTQGYMSALGKGLFGMSDNLRSTWLVEADAAKFKTEVRRMAKASQEMFLERIKEEQ